MEMKKKIQTEGDWVESKTKQKTGRDPGGEEIKIIQKPLSRQIHSVRLNSV